MRSLLQNLRETNQRLHFWIERVAPGQAAVAAPEPMAGLLSELLRVGASLRQEPISAKGNNPVLDGELEKYRCNVERLRDILPAIHDQLLAERASLEAQRTRVRAAAEWANASRQTL